MATFIRSLATLPIRPGSLFPLMVRELTEQASRQRTYILRVLYALAVYGITLWSFWTELGSWSAQSFAFLGQGRQFFLTLGWLQFGGLYLFLPAMASGVLTSEKERDTLSLLLLTRLGPWSILIGKLLSRLIPMGSVIVLSLPLFAVAYSLGGVDEVEILSLAWVLLVTSLQIGSLALACSAWCRTTGAAFVATYLIGAALILGPYYVTQGGHIDPFGIVTVLQRYLDLVGYGDGIGQQGYSVSPEEVSLMLFGPLACLDSSIVDPFGTTRARGFGTVVVRTIPLLLFAGTCLLFARIVLWRRAFVPPSNFLLKVFRSLDKVFHTMNQNRFTKGIVLTHEHVVLPVFDPIRWRETKKKSLGTTRYLVRLLLVLEVPVLFGMLIPHYGGATVPPVYVAAWVLWVVATLVISIQATGLIGSERSRQTLDVLLTTTMSSETIVREKFAGIRRLIRVLWIPFATIYVFQIWWCIWVGSNERELPEIVLGFVQGVLAVVIYPPLIAWLGFYWGMRCRSQTQAAMVTLTLIAAACTIPWVISDALGTEEISIIREVKWLSPAIILSVCAFSNRQMWYTYSYVVSPDARMLEMWLGVLIHFALAGMLLIWLWVRGLKSFARYVHRNDGQVIDDDDIERLSRLREQVVGSGVFRAATDDE